MTIHTEIIELIDFSSLIQKSLLERLAESDDHEKVKSVAEFFSDYVPITPELYTPIKDPLEGLLSICLALKKRPVIRAQRGSKAAARLGGDLAVRDINPAILSLI